MHSSGGAAKGTGRPALGLVSFNDYFYLGSPRAPLGLGESELQKVSEGGAKTARCYFGIARRYLRMAMALMRSSQIYLPSRLRKKDSKPEERTDYYLMIWPYLRDKWQKLDALKAAFAEDRPLGRWRNMVQGIYDIKLKL